MLKFFLVASSTVIVAFNTVTPGIAQSITAAPDGTGTVITVDGHTYHIEGGTQAGANLFHSFQDFGLSQSEIVNFLSQPGIMNILGRVTGGNASIIDGLLQVSGSNANLYLMNPAGIVFGPGASLNVGGDFTATTADHIGFAAGNFNASGTNDYAALIGAPKQFAFASPEPGAILNFGDLTAPKQVSLISGTVVNQGKVASTQGNVTIAAVPGERLVKISQPGMLLSLELPKEAIAAGIPPVKLPQLLTGSEGYLPEAVPVDSEAVSLSGNVVIAGEVSGQQVDLYAAGQVTPTDADLIQGDTRVVRFSATGENPTQAVFIDERADNPTDLLFGAASGTVVQIIEREDNGIALISEQVSAISDAVGKLDSLAIVAEGHEGNFWLGTEWIRAETIGDYAAQLQTWGNALTENADLLLYSCFTALGATGESLVVSIANLTQLDVAASINATGSANYGGDWQLEHQIGEIEVGNPFTPEMLSHWDGKLATLTVTSSADAGAGSLRQRIQTDAAAGDMIVFDTARTITLTSGSIGWLTDNLTLDGNGSTVDGNNASEVFNIGATNATIENLTIQNGSRGASGGGIYANGGGTLMLNNTTVSGNSTGFYGGGVYTVGTLALNNSTIANNSAANQGGGLFTVGAGTITLTNSTVSGNLSGFRGGGIRGAGGAITLTNSTVSGNSAAANGGGIYSPSAVNLTNATIAFNTAGDGGGGLSVSGTQTNQILNTIIANNTDTSTVNAPDIGADLSNSTVQHSLITTTSGITSQTLTNGVNGNIIGQDPLLGPLQNNGGSTATHALLVRSPAINAGNNSLVNVEIDQTGNVRIVDFTVDIGAYELPTITSFALPFTCELFWCEPTDFWQFEALYYDAGFADSSSLVDATVEDAEAQISSDYAELISDETTNTDPVTLAEAQQILQTIQTQTGVQPALIYFTFAPNAIATQEELNADTLVASTLDDLWSLDLSQRRRRNQNDELQLILVTPQGQPVFERTGVTRARVTRQVKNFRRQLTDLSNAYLQPAQKLYDWLIAPLELHLQQAQVDNLSVIAADGLRSLPLATLHNGQNFLIEDYSLGQLPSLSLVDWRYRSLNTAQVLAMGASEFQAEDPLHAVPTELALVTGQRGDRQYLNESFTIEGMRSQTQDRQFQVLHLATHALFDGDTADDAYVQLWADQALQLSSFRGFGLHEEPPLELLVLSACQTALGSSEAELGFAGAALQSGVKSVLASLWKVSDLGTLALMNEFYTQLANPEITTKAEALRQSQLRLLRGEIDPQIVFGQDLALPSELVGVEVDLTHPFVWSSFTLVGSPW
ncbi:MAG: CHAT domain-containing protein [Spirulina sp. SIO3F2]|nr:CHAT domain-containing protein [Spirulina sp. SIO3F2]